MVDAKSPHNPRSAKGGPVCAEVRFEGFVDEAYRQNAARIAGQGPEPVALLSYAAGRLEGDALEAFQEQLCETFEGSMAVVATMKATRPAAPDAPLARQFSTTLTQRLVALIGAAPKSDARSILRTVAAACHEAMLRTHQGEHRAAMLVAVEARDRARAQALASEFGGALGALALGALELLDEARDLWRAAASGADRDALLETLSLTLEERNPNSSHPVKQNPKPNGNGHPITQLNRLLAVTPATPDALLRALLKEFVYERHAVTHAPASAATSI